MIKRDVQLTISTVLAGWLLAVGAAPAGAQPVAPPSPATAGQPGAASDSGAADPTSAAPPVAAAAAASPADKNDKATAKPVAPGAALPAGTSIKVERTAKGAKLFRITEGLVVEGQMQRPNAFLVLQRAAVDYDYEALRESFLPRILSATREKPF